jgi:hypothetical protein
MSWEKTAKFAVPLFWRAGAGLSAPTLYNLGWLSDLDATTIVPPAAAHPVALRPLYGDTTGSNPTRMIRVIEPKQGWVYTAEYRVPLSWDQGIRTARVVIHAMRTLYQAGQDGWRWCANCEGLIYAGQTVCPAGGVHGDEPSEDYRLLFHRGSGDPIWRWCRRCSGLFFADNVRESECPAGGEHDGTGSSDYQVALGGTGQISGQSNWKWCNKCEGLAYDGNSTRGTCPAGGVHDHINSGDYALWTEDPPFPFQNKWRWCNKCQGLYYAGLGACQGHDVHRFGEDLDYALVHDLAGASGEGGWRWCSKCYAMAFYDSSRALGACAAGGTHDHSTSGQYVIPRDAEAEAGQRQWHWCSKCSALNYTDPTRGPGPCSAGGNHSPGNIEYLVAHDTSAVAGATGFRWCSKCENMVMGNSPASCIRGGNHDTSRSSNYVVRMDPASLAREQSYWRTCAKCSTLFALNSPDGSDEKPCAGGGKHSVTGEYFLTYVTPDPFWRWCSKCESMAFWDGSRSPGPCPAGGPHDHSASGSYIPPNFRLDVTQVVNDNLLAGGSWSDSSDRVRFDVTAMDASGATVQVTAT